MPHKVRELAISYLSHYKLDFDSVKCKVGLLDEYSPTSYKATGIVADISSLQLTAINVSGMSQSVRITPSNHTEVCLCSLSYIRIPGIGQTWGFLNTW